MNEQRRRILDIVGGLGIAVIPWLSASCATAELPAALDLSGAWSFRLDPEDRGVIGRWYEQDLPDAIQLPGMLQAQGYGERPRKDSEWLAGIGERLIDDPRFERFLDSGDFRSPFWLTPPRHYVGPAWYRRDVTVPATWAGKHIVLFLERPHWETTVWVGHRRIGSQSGLGVPHEHDLSDALRPGRQTITIRVDNSYIVPVGRSAHSISDETQGNWNGIVGRIELRAASPVWIDDVQVHPDVERREVRVEVEIGNRTGRAGKGRITLSATARNVKTTHRVEPLGGGAAWTDTGGRVALVYELGPGALLWDEFRPALYDLEVRLRSDDEVGAADLRTVTFGLREIGVRGTQLTLNGRPIFLRGTLECCIFPRLGHPPTDVAPWKRILEVARAHGLNHLRFHSWCPPGAAFVAADEMGFFLQAESSCWASFGDGSPVDRWVHEETERMMRHHGNHPSFILLAPSNEPGGRNRDVFLGRFVEHWKKRDPRRLYTAGAGWPQIPENQYHIQARTRLQNWGPLKLDRAPQTFDDYREYIESLGVPTVSHEIGQWCAYPNLEEVRKYTGFFRGGNIESFAEILAEKGMADRAREFLMASGNFQAILYKAEIEAALRTPGMAGFQLLDLHDFPGQGTAPVGALDVFWESKGYVSGEEYRRFCGVTVPLARLRKLVWTAGETLEARIDIAHYGPDDLDNVAAHWEIRGKDGTVHARATLAGATVPTGTVTELGTVGLELAPVLAPSRLELVVRLEGTEIENDWSVWVYPEANAVETAAPSTVLVTGDAEEALTRLGEGGRVLLELPPHRVAGRTLGTFQPIFWNRVTFTRQKVHTVGIVCDPEHPALAAFPTDYHADWQWQDVLDHYRPMVLDGLPADLRPIVQPIDDWNNARRLALLFEARVGAGRLLVSSADLGDDLESRPVARQLRHSILRYAASEAFRPPVELEETHLISLLRRPSAMERLGARATADSAQSGYGARQAIDDDPVTIWHTSWEGDPDPMPHHLTISLERPTTIRGLVYVPRGDMANGRIARYAIHVSAADQEWGEPVATGTWPDTAASKTVTFERPVEARHVRLVALSEVRGQPFASAAEVRLLLE